MENVFRELTQLLRDGVVTSKDIIKMVEKKVENGNFEPSILTYTIKYLTLIEKINKMDGNALIDIQELVDLGFYDSVDEIKEMINENPEEFKGCVFRVKPCVYTEPTLDEINTNLDVDTDKNCIICCCRLKNTVFIPCGHSLCCTVCSKIIAEKAKTEDKHVECLVCKTNVDLINKVYL